MTNRFDDPKIADLVARQQSAAFIESDHEREARQPLDGGGEPPHDGRMETRIRELEKSVSDIKVSLGKLETSVAALPSKEDFNSIKIDFRDIVNDQKKWSLATSWTVIAVGVIGLFGLLFTIYNANKPSSPQPPRDAPLIIQLPPYAPSSAPAPLPAQTQAKH